MSFIGDTKRAFSSRDYREDYYDSEYEYDDEEYEEEYEEDGKSAMSFLAKIFGKKNDDEEIEEEERNYSRASRKNYSSEKTSSQKGTSSRPNSTVNYSPSTAAGLEIVALSHFNFTNAAEIVKEVKRGKVILFDISTLESAEDARRVVDYIGGAAEGMDCNFEKLFPSVFGISPKNVSITAKKSRLR